MAQPSSVPPTSTFVVRFWKEWSATGSRWRGRIEHVQSGQRVGFQDLERMMGFIHSFGVSVQDDDQTKKEVEESKTSEGGN